MGDVSKAVAAAPFAKLFETPHGQLLAFLSETDDEEPSITVMGAEYEGVRPAATLSGWAEGDEGQERALAEMDQAKADDMAAKFHAMLVDLVVPSSGSTPHA